MITRVGGKRIGKANEKCVIKTCRKSIEKEAVYEWKWFIQDSTSAFDGEEHHVKLCASCYANLENQMMHHVVSSNSIDGYVAYGGALADLDDREKERLHPTYRKERQCASL